VYTIPSSNVTFIDMYPPDLMLVKNKYYLFEKMTVSFRVS